MHAVVADGGELTVVRRLVNFVYGSWNVTWPQDFEPPALDEGRVLGYVGVLAEDDPGLSARRFTRADVNIVAADDQVVPPEPGFSNVEEIFDHTMRRASGAVFFEKDIPTKNLGRLTPHVDFQLGSRIPVRLWGRVLPGQLVTAIRQIATPDEPCGWLVHVGGQALGDDATRVREMREFERQIAQERRERVKGIAGEAKARAQALRAESEARAAVSEDLLRATEATGEAIAGVKVTADAAKQWTEENQVAFNLATSLAFSAQQQMNDFNAIQWLQQTQWNATQEEINETQAKINAAQDQWNRESERLNSVQDAEIRRLDLVKREQQDLINMMARPLAATREGYRPDVETIRGRDEDAFGALTVTMSRVTFQAKGRWTGTVYALIQIEALNSYSVLSAQRVTHPGQTLEFTRNVFQSINSAVVFYKAIA